MRERSEKDDESKSSGVLTCGGVLFLFFSFQVLAGLLFLRCPGGALLVSLKLINCTLASMKKEEKRDKTCMQIIHGKMFMTFFLVHFLQFQKKVHAAGQV
jgi:hypothetical protein